MPAPRFFPRALPLPFSAIALVVATACGPRSAPSSTGAADAGTTGTATTPSSEAPPFASSPAPVVFGDRSDAGDAPPPEPSASAIPASPSAPPRLACPRGMMAVEGRFCIDKWEASLIDKATRLPLSPYYPPDRRLAAQLAETWEKQRLEIGSDHARQIPLPPLPDWQRSRDVEPVAQSRAGVLPNGYLSGVMAERACNNAQKRLCRYEEWVTACEGDAKRRFPYGTEYRQGACNIFRAIHPALELHGNAALGHLDPRLNLVREESGDPLLRRTGATPACRSDWGAEAAWDMNGNLDEWVDDEKGRFVGGFFSRSKRDGCESSVTAHPKTYLDYSTGARCCWSPEEAP
jgi:sulfatase modifying factor 1